jgi:hypothetical protein
LLLLFLLYSIGSPNFPFRLESVANFPWTAECNPNYYYPGGKNPPKSAVAKMQAPMLSCPLKQTNEIDWISPLKDYIRDSYGDDPERYSEECAMLNRLRQDMRGAGRDSASGRDLLYRYYGQLELLDLRFPVDEHHIKISFTW